MSTSPLLPPSSSSSSASLPPSSPYNALPRIGSARQLDDGSSEGGSSQGGRSHVTALPSIGGDGSVLSGGRDDDTYDASTVASPSEFGEHTVGASSVGSATRASHNRRRSASASPTQRPINVGFHHVMKPLSADRTHQKYLDRKLKKEAALRAEKLAKEQVRPALLATNAW